MEGKGKKIKKKVAFISKTGKERIRGVKWIRKRKQKKNDTEYDKN